MAEENDVGVGFFFEGKCAIVIRIQQLQDGLVGSLPAAVLEYADVGAFGKRLTDLLGQLNGPVMRVVMPDEATDETDHNVGWSGSGLGSKGSSVYSSGESGHRRGQNCQSGDRNAKWSKTVQQGFQLLRCFVSSGRCGKRNVRFAGIASAG